MSEPHSKRKLSDILFFFPFFFFLASAAHEAERCESLSGIVSSIPLADRAFLACMANSATMETIPAAPRETDGSVLPRTRISVRRISAAGTKPSAIGASFARSGTHPIADNSPFRLFTRSHNAHDHSEEAGLKIPLIFVYF